MNFFKKTFRNLTKGRKKNMGYFLLALVIIFFVLWLASRYANESFSNGVKIVYFRMEGCPYCMKFDPIWKEFCSGRSDCKKVSSKDPLTRKIGVSSFPTICKVNGGRKVSEFNGDRTVSALNSWAQ